MSSNECVIVFDCGSTNIRVIAIDSNYNVVAQRSKPNSPIPQPDGKPNWLIWDLDKIWQSLCTLSKQVISSLGDKYQVVAVTVTTWGADGALVKRDGSLAYPIISWQCPRTKEIIPELLSRIDPWEIFKITGYQIIYFNTLLKLMWIRKYAPKAFREAYTWLMMPGLIVHRLTNSLHIDPTSASTMMAMDLAKRDWSSEMLALADLDSSFFPEWKEPGEIAGYITSKAHKHTGIKEGVPVIVSGHDTQFAILAASATKGELVLSSGTWEILALRLDRYTVNRTAFEEGIIIEADVEPGIWNPQLLMIASGVLEWIRKLFYPELSKRDYQVMINEALKESPGANNVLFIPSFVSDSGPTRKYGTQGTILGLSLNISRGCIYRAALEGLSYQLRLAVEVLTRSFDLNVKGIRVVGGGSKNDLWNTIRANVLGLPVYAMKLGEATVLGATITAFKGIDFYKSFDEALRDAKLEFKEYLPDPELHRLYRELYERYVYAIKTLESYYKRHFSH